MVHELEKGRPKLLATMLTMGSRRHEPHCPQVTELETPTTSTNGTDNRHQHTAGIPILGCRIRIKT